MRTRAVGDRHLLGSRAAPTKNDPTCVVPYSTTPPIETEAAEYIDQFKATFDLIPTMVWMFGPDGKCRFFNKRWLEFRGRTLAEERDSGWTQGIHPEEREQCIAAVSCAFEVRQPLHLQFRVKGAEGSYARMVAHAVPQYLLNGTFVGYVGSIEHQHSGAKRLTKCLDASVNTSTINRSRMLDRAFLHDLANSAGAIQTLLDLLQEESSPLERAEYVGMLQVSTNRLLAEIEHERKLLESTNPERTIHTARQVLEALIQSHLSRRVSQKCRIEVAEGPLDGMMVLADKAVIVRVLDNMLRNAVEASDQGGVVRLGCREIEGKLEFWAHNENVISEKIRVKIFKQSISTKGCGRGIGTQSIKLSSELYLGGTVTVTSDEKRGTTFSVRFPAAPETGRRIAVWGDIKNVS